MSGITGSCIVCGAFHATGHMGDEHILLSYDGEPLLACPKCIPFAPHHGEVRCFICGVPAVRMIYPKGTYRAKLKTDFICQTCEEARRHKLLHERMERIK